jgi:hypothetical protein
VEKRVMAVLRGPVNVGVTEMPDCAASIGAMAMAALLKSIQSETLSQVVIAFTPPARRRQAKARRRLDLLLPALSARHKHIARRLRRRAKIL